MDPDFASGVSGTLGRRTSALGALRDLATDVVTAPRRLALQRAARSASPQRVLAVSVARPERAGSAAAAAHELERTTVHELAVRLAAPRPGAGKWENLNALLESQTLGDHDWLLIFDDDVVLPRGFLDSFLFLCGRFDLVLAQPAHKFFSHAAWAVTRRRAASVARRTRFVEIGPVTAIRADAFPTLLPFPELHMGWGLDAHWGAVAAEHGWPVGIIDATPVRHTRPVAGGYDQSAARRGGRSLPRRQAVRPPRPSAADDRELVRTLVRVCRRRRVLPACRRAGARDLGPPAGAGGAGCGSRGGGAGAAPARAVAGGAAGT